MSDLNQVLANFETRHFVSAGTATVCYRRAGDGAPLVLLHGYPLCGLTWRRVVPGLSRQFTCYAFDLVGLGHSISSDSNDFSSQGQAKVLQRALALLGVEQYALLANDSGGWIARELALLEPDRVTHLILTNTEIPGHRPPWVWFYQILARLPGGSYLFQMMLSSRAWRRSGMGFGGCFQNHDLIDGEFAEIFLAPLLACRSRISTALRFLLTMKFRRIDEFRQLHHGLTMPVAFVWGAADPTFPEARARRMTSQFPMIKQFTSISAGKLFVQEEFPESLIKHVLEFLTSV
jgi:pimeloyl-ACP methyl ester carboxylesterase